MATDSTHDEQGLPIRPLPDGSDVRKAKPEERARVVEVLARGFYDDPLFEWMLPRDDRRLRRNERVFDLFARRAWMPQEETWTTDRLAGAACWMPPGTADQSVLEQLLMLPGLVAACGRAFPRAMSILNAFDKDHPHEPHWYLPVIAVAPEWQGRGFGAALLRPVLERCDAERLPAYLEATSPRNRALYERHGFAVTEELRIKDAPPVWRMWREPQPAQPSSASTA
jgi:GNAT superfamily N-acetyltransferase